MSDPIQLPIEKGCSRCGLRPDEHCSGYPSPEDVAIVLEECPPPWFKAFAQALRDHKAGKLRGGAALSFNGSNGGTQDWEMRRTTVENNLAFRKRKV